MVALDPVALTVAPRDLPSFIVEHVHPLPDVMTSMASTLSPLSPLIDLPGNLSTANHTLWNDTDIGAGSGFFPGNESFLVLGTTSGSPHAASGTSSVAHHAYVKPWPPLKQTTGMIVLLCVFYMLVLVLGTINNSLVVSVIYRNMQMRTVTNYFIANLAIADILVSILVIPTLLSSIFTEWWYGSFLCKVAPYLQGVATSTSVNTLAAVAIERYLAIFYPQTSRITVRTAFIMIGVIWLIPMCIFIPWLVVYIQKVYTVRGLPFVQCTADWSNMEIRKMYTLGAVFLTCYLIPLLFISVFYLLIGVRVWKRNVRGIRGSRAERNINRSKTRILSMLVVVFVMFALSWLPLYSIELRILFGKKPDPSERVLLKNYLIPIAQWLGASNSCVNPFIYCYFSTNFRNSIVQVVRSRTCCGKITT